MHFYKNSKGSFSSLFLIRLAFIIIVVIIGIIFIYFLRSLQKNRNVPLDQTETCTNTKKEVRSICILSYTLTTCVRKTGNVKKEDFLTTIDLNTDEVRFDKISSFLEVETERGKQCGKEHNKILKDVAVQLGRRADGYNYSIAYRNRMELPTETREAYKIRMERNGKELEKYTKEMEPVIKSGHYDAAEYSRKIQETMNRFP